MSMRTLLQQVRSALTSHEALTNLVSAEKITFARRPQRDQLPGITMAIGNVIYDETKQSELSAISYRVDVIIYGRSADETTEIHDAIKQAFLNVSSSTFNVRLMDERYFVDADDIHSGFVSARWQLASGPSANATVMLSPAFQGADRMKFKSNLSMANGGTTTLDLDTHGYSLDFTTHSGAASHTVVLPAAIDYMGKMYTFVFGSNVDNNSTVIFDPSVGRIEGGNTYIVDRGLSSMTIVAVESPSGVQQWRIIAYKGLHD